MKAQPSSELIGHQEYVQVGDQPVLTLRELWPAEPRAMIVGLNPAPVSVSAGHYYQGRSGRQRMALLAAADLFDPPGPGQFVDDVALTAGVGFADLVRRPTTGEKDLGKAEIHQGAQRLRRELTDRRVPLVLCVFRHPAIELTGLPKKTVKPGIVPSGDLTGLTVFRMPGPYAAKATTQAVMDQLSELLGLVPDPHR
jgi:double-stranded uracil-DNA glycosylase